jgi:hypothetical protein
MASKEFYPYMYVGSRYLGSVGFRPLYMSAQIAPPTSLTSNNMIDTVSCHQKAATTADKANRNSRLCRLTKG